MNGDAPAAKNIEVICPVISSAITYEKDDGKGKKIRVHDMAKAQCLRGSCAWFNVGKFKCSVLVIAEGLVQK